MIISWITTIGYIPSSISHCRRLESINLSENPRLKGLFNMVGSMDYSGLVLPGEIGFPNLSGCLSFLALHHTGLERKWFSFWAL